MMALDGWEQVPLYIIRLTCIGAGTWSHPPQRPCAPGPGSRRARSRRAGAL